MSNTLYEVKVDKVLSDRDRRSVVTLADNGFVYKHQPKHLTQNEWYALELLAGTGFVPEAYLVDIEIIKMKYIVSEPIGSPDVFRRHCYKFLELLIEVGLRHGDLTDYAVFVVNDSPIVIDWAESRLAGDPRPDKRPEGDEFWMMATAEKLIAGG